MKKFESLILEYIRRYAMLEKGDKILLALSGGPDSVCLTILFDRIRNSLGISLEAGHVNYGLRGKDSDRDEEFARALCQRLGIPLHLARTDPRRGGNLEETARNQRYQFLSEIACREGMKIATGHNSDDQAETFLLNLVRGAGYKGLSGMLPIREYQGPGGKKCAVIRPLLRVTREQITNYLGQLDQDFRIDRSNSSLEYDRNWIRHEMLPRIEERFNPGQAERIARASVLIGEAARFLEDEASRRLEEISHVSVDGSLQLSIAGFEGLQEVLRREILRLAVARIKGNLTDITSRHIYAIRDLMRNQSGRRIRIPGGIEVMLNFDYLSIGYPAKPTPRFEYTMIIPGTLNIPEVGKTLQVTPASPQPPGGKGERPPKTKVVVRNRRPGDRLRISSNRPRQTFSNICGHYRIPENQRDQLLIIEFPDGSHWVEGIGLPAGIKTGDATITEFKIRIEHSPGPG